MEFIELLKDYKAKNKLTIPKFAEFLGVPQRTLENWLFGKNKPNSFTVKAITDKLKG